MAQPRPPAAYLRATQGCAPDTLARQHAAVAEAAISAGRHDTLLLAGAATVRGNPARVMRLLASCTKHGVAVELVGPPAPHNSGTMPGGAPVRGRPDPRLLGKDHPSPPQPRRRPAG